MRSLHEKVCVCSDFHIGIHQASQLWHETAIDFAKWLKNELLERNITDIVIAGDVGNDRNEIPLTTLHYIYNFFKILEDFNIVILVGNHDCYYSKRSDIHSLGLLNNWENITIIDKTSTITAQSKTITFCPWSTPIEEIPKSDILIGHFEIQTFRMDGRKICDHGIKSQDLLEKAPLVISGHFHLTDERHYQNGTVLYLGSPYELTWNEYMSPKGIHILDISTSKYEFIRNNYSPKHKKIRLSELMALGKITDDIKKEFNNNIVNFIIDVKVDQQIVDTLVSKFSLLKPLELKTEYALVEAFEVDDQEFEFSGINIQSDMIEFVKSLENVEKKDVLVNYLTDIHKRAEVLTQK